MLANTTTSSRAGWKFALKALTETRIRAPCQNPPDSYIWAASQSIVFSAGELILDNFEGVEEI
ncbi:hypothetical protein LINPERHAP1_LOCUS16563, partial [Linum perenne]